MFQVNKKNTIKVKITPAKETLPHFTRPKVRHSITHRLHVDYPEDFQQITCDSLSLQTKIKFSVNSFLTMLKKSITRYSSVY